MILSRNLSEAFNAQVNAEMWSSNLYLSMSVYFQKAGLNGFAHWMKPKDSDWLQGYGYQMWRCRHNAVRADGANGQYIIILPEQDAVIAMTANIGDMQAEIDLIWKYILPALR